MRNQIWKVSVSETESGEVQEVILTDLAGASAILGGYEKDDFYTAEAEFVGFAK
jgi:hypothetical protein